MKVFKNELSGEQIQTKTLTELLALSLVHIWGH
jgi:hypothetical protein